MKRLRITIERFLLRGVHYRLFAAGLIIATVSLVAGGLVLFLDPQHEDFGDALWWAFLRLSDPGYLGDDEGTIGRTVSTVVTVLGYVLFLGLLVAILTQWMNDWIRRVETGLSELPFSDHILIMGWNHRTPSIVLELLRATGRVTRFLKKHDAHTLRIVILDDAVDVDLRDNLRSALGPHWDDRRVILRRGNPLHLDGLERASFRDAAAIIFPGADFATAQPGVSDAEVIKALATISHHAGNDDRYPQAVAALYNANRGQVAAAAYPGPLEVVRADQSVARLLAQSALKPGVWGVYAELLSINDGNSLFVHPMPDKVDASFAELRAGAGDSTLIGLISGSTNTVRLNPPADTRVSSNDQLIFIARRNRDCQIETGASLKLRSSNSMTLREDETFARRILILGWSRKIPLLVREMLRYSDAVREIDIVGIATPAERENTLAGMEQASVNYVMANFLNPDELESLAPETYDSIIFIARERLGEEAVADAATLSACVTLAMMPSMTDDPHVVAEILEEENVPLFQQKVDDVMVSPMAVSYVLSQVALAPPLRKVYSELVHPSGTHFALRKIEPQADTGRMRFGDLSTAATLRGELAIGILSPNVDDGRVVLNASDDLGWEHNEKDRLIVLTAAMDEA
ncbi:MAG: CASTOR/POLLUX-related putative ion channel [Gammaproteobacteria bacterium]